MRLPWDAEHPPWAAVDRAVEAVLGERVHGWFVDEPAVALDVVLAPVYGVVLAYTLLQPFGVPGTIFIMVAPLIWPWQVAFALSLTGTMTASMVGFGFARFLRTLIVWIVAAEIRHHIAAVRIPTELLNRGV